MLDPNYYPKGSPTIGIRVDSDYLPRELGLKVAWDERKQLRQFAKDENEIRKLLKLEYLEF